MNGLINFIKNLLGFEDPQECMIGLAHFENHDMSLHDEAPAKKSSKQEMTLSQMLKRAS